MKILLATDGSDHALEATAQCGELVSAMKNSSIKIITVSDYVFDFDSDSFDSEKEFIDLLEEEIQKRSEKILTEAEKIIRYKNEKIEIEMEMFIGTAKKVILEEAHKWKPDLLIVGSHGYGFFYQSAHWLGFGRPCSSRSMFGTGSKTESGMTSLMHPI